MRALVCHQLSADLDLLKVEDRAVPTPPPGFVRLAMRAVAVGFPDFLMVQGLYQVKPPLPFTPGAEGVGIIEELGEGVEGWHIGDRVLAGLGVGGFAEQALASALAIRRVPGTLDDTHAAALTSAYLTAYVSLHHRGALQAGETLLVHGSAGGVGLAAVDVGKLMGAHVIATSSFDDKLEVVKQKGADHTINLREGFKDRVKELTKGRGADVIYDPVGGDVFDQSTRCINFAGRLLVVGFASGRIPEIGANIPLIKSFSVVGVRAGEFSRRNPELGRQAIAQIDHWASEGKLTAHVQATFPLERAADAIAMLQDRKAVGRVVVTMGENI